MASVRKASTYSKKTTRPFTRISKNRTKAYIKTVPNNKIAKYSQGSAADFKAGKHPYLISLKANEKVQIRDLALEACRMFVTKMMESQASGQFFLSMHAYPHHLLRENKLSAGAGADRLSTGMTQSYGIIVGRAALVKPGQTIMFISCANEKAARIARDSLKKIKSKVPCSATVSFEKIA